LPGECPGIDLLYFALFYAFGSCADELIFYGAHSSNMRKNMRAGQHRGNHQLNRSIETVKLNYNG
jgi:hypothetical protein